MKHAIVTLLIALAIGAVGYGLGQQHPHEPAPTPAAQAPAKPLYICPMHPHIVQDHPGNCPICGMDLVAADKTGDAAHQLHVDAASLQKLGVRLATARTETLSYDIDTHATLAADENAILRITPNVAGVVTKLHVHGIGQRIAAGQMLYEISSQDALNLQYEYLDILYRGAPTQKMADERRAQNRKLLAGANDPARREQAERIVHQSEEQLWSILQPLQRDRDRVDLRLRQIGFSNAMLHHLSQSKQASAEIAMRAQRPCVVKEVLARPGMQVEPMTEILTCVDPTQTWLELTLYPDQLPWLHEGDAVEVTFDDGTTATTRLTGLNPLLDKVSHTARTRLPIELGRSGNLGEYASVTIHAAPREVLAVPRNAVMRTGHGNFVMRALGNGHFMPVKVVTGIETAERTAILDGLEAGDQVAVNGQFLLDAAASIAATAERLKDQ